MRPAERERDVPATAITGVVEAPFVGNAQEVFIDAVLDRIPEGFVPAISPDRLPELLATFGLLPSSSPPPYTAQLALFADTRRGVPAWIVKWTGVTVTNQSIRLRRLAEHVPAPNANRSECDGPPIDGPETFAIDMVIVVDATNGEFVSAWRGPARE